MGIGRVGCALGRVRVGLWELSDTCFYPPLDCLGIKWHHHFPSWEKGDGVNPVLKHSLPVLQHRGSSIPRLSPGSASSGTSLSHHVPLFPLFQAPVLPFLSPVRLRS